MLSIINLKKSVQEFLNKESLTADTDHENKSVLQYFSAQLSDLFWIPRQANVFFFFAPLRSTDGFSGPVLIQNVCDKVKDDALLYVSRTFPASVAE